MFVISLILACTLSFAGSVPSDNISPDLMRDFMELKGNRQEIPHVYKYLQSVFSLPDTIRAIGNTARPYLLQATDQKKDCLSFSHVSSNVISALGAELHVYIPRLVRGVEGDVFSILIRRHLPKGVREDHYVVTWANDWVQLNISQSIEDIDFWLKTGICISVIVNGKTNRPDPLYFNSNYTDDLAFVMAWSSEILSLPQIKTRRSSRRDRFRESLYGHSNIYSKNRVKFGDRCTLQPLYIDFRDLGWESWIIAPPGLELGTCSGVCTREVSNPFSNYNLVIDAINRDPDLSRLYTLAGIRTGRCCVPTKFLPSVIMFVDHKQNIVVQLVENMLVGQCSCV